MRKVYNFSAGPAVLPEEVLLRAQAELLDWHGTGISIMELGHRGPEFQQVADQAEADLRELLSIPKNYHVLFLSGGATTQFTMVPINLLDTHKTADYVDTGIWSKKAMTEAKKYGHVNTVTELKIENSIIQIPKEDQWSTNPEASYLHYTPNETIEGVEFHWTPNTGKVPLVADMTSMILSRPININDYGLIYAGAQKNAGPAGITLVIIREDLIKEPLPGTPTLYRYDTHAEYKSFYNTPPTYAWYLCGLVFDWLKRQGGIEVIYEVNKRKAMKMYDFIDANSEFYINHVHSDCRSIMNVPFNLKDNELLPGFLDLAAKEGLTHLKGHRLVGGVRASIYNAMPEAAIDQLVEFMGMFLKRYG